MLKQEALEEPAESPQEHSSGEAKSIRPAERPLMPSLPSSPASPSLALVPREQLLVDLGKYSLLSF